MVWIGIAFGLLAFLSFALNIWQFAVAVRFPLHERVRDRSFTPPITILKPLKGCDPETEHCLRSWFTQDYAGVVQILFGAASGDDPVCPVVQRLLAEFPNCDAQFLKCTEALGANSKVSTLTQLQRHVKHGLVLVSDADVRVSPDFLTNVIFPLRDSRVGLVNCFYKLANPMTLAMRWEAIAINADFWSQVLQSRSLKPLDFALGAVMVTRRTLLDEIGGFAVLLEYLADDYQLGSKIAASGHGIELCPVVVECWERPMDWLAVLNHQLRWARTIRFCQPAPYFLSIVGNPTLWPLLWLFIYPANWAFGVTMAMLLWRVFSAQILQNRLTQAPPHPIDASLVPLKDLMGAGIWLAAFLGSEIEWRNEFYRVASGGKLVKLKNS